MKLSIIIKSIFFIISFQINYSLAIPEIDYYTNNISPIKITGPADRLPAASVITFSGFRSGLTICNNSDIEYTLSRIDYEPLAPVSGQPNDSPLTLFETGVPEFTFTPTGSLMSITSNGPLPTTIATVWRGNLSNSSRISSPITISASVYINKTADRFVGIATLPTTKMYRYVCYDQNGKAQEAVNILYREITINADVTTCEPTSKVITLDMDKILASVIENASAVTNIATKRQTFSLLCDPNIDVFVSFVDLTDTTNKTNVANLTPDSTASGVGFVVTGGSGQRFLFGPDGSADNVPGQTKYFVQRSGTADKNNPMSFTIGFSYVRKPEETFKTGSAKAMIGLTYSYQ